MKYIHEELLGNNFIRRWCNEVENISDPDYNKPTFEIHKIGTNEYYTEAVDLPNDERIRLGLEPFRYEITDIPVDRDADGDNKNVDG